MARKNGASRTYGAYVFKTKDPAIDELRTVIEGHFGRRVCRPILTEIHESGGPSIAAMSGWFFGATERPQNPTLEAAGRALGFRRVWRQMKK